ncbi:aspartate aminotransferase family protein [Pirellulales bacterium]|nr:aspartate aminotransferase family protein [Pirellulales bacterium]
MLKTDQSASLYERACRSLATGVSTAFRRHVTAVPIYFERGDGPYLYDVDGQEFVDYALAWGPLIVGNNHPQLTAAIQEQISKAYTFGAQHRGEIDLAEKMIRAIPGAGRVIFSNTGSEAVQAALRLARGFTGRDKVVKFEGHYHGWHNNMLVSNHPSPDQYGRTVPDCGGQPEPEYSLTITCPWNDIQALQEVIAQNRGQIAAVIGEPILVNGGSCMPGERYLQSVIDLCRDEGAVSIFDEVITGFRIALGGAREFFSLQPDLSVYAKAMAAGFSISAVAGGSDIFATLSDGRTSHFGTYNGNPVCCAAASATIDILSQPGTFERMHAHGKVLRQAIEDAAKACSQQLVTTGTGSAFHVHFGLEQAPCNIRDLVGVDSEAGKRFQMGLLARGVYNLPGGRWYVGATHSDRELERVIPAINDSMRGVAT